MAKKRNSIDPEYVPYVVKRVTAYESDVMQEVVGRSAAQRLADKYQAEETDPEVTYKAEPFEAPPRGPRRRGLGGRKQYKVRKRR
jgi:hypothetical protein